MRLGLPLLLAVSLFPVVGRAQGAEAPAVDAPPAAAPPAVEPAAEAAPASDAPESDDERAAPEAAAPEATAPEATAPATTVEERDADEPRPSDFLDTRLFFGFSDDNWLRGPGETSPSSPAPDFSSRSNNELFFDGLNRPDSGFETMSHAAIYGRADGFIPGVVTEAALIARFLFSSDDDTGRFGARFGDYGTYLRLRYFFSGSTSDDKAPNLELVAFPFNSDVMRLGYLYDITWGGVSLYGKGVSVPGAKLQLNLGDGYVYAGAKTARLLDESINEVDAYWGALGGAGWDLFDMVAVDVGAGVFQRGTNPLVGVEGEPVVMYGGSSRLALHFNVEAPQSSYFRLYRNEAGAGSLYSVVRPSRGGMWFYSTLEYTHAQQLLQDPGDLQNTKIQAANAAALSMRFGWEDLTIGADSVYRDLSFKLFNVPSFVPYQAFPEDAVLSPEILVALNASYYLKALHLTPGIVFGFQVPSTFVGLDPGSLAGADVKDISDRQVVVVRTASTRDILPCAKYDDPTSPARVCEQAQQAEPAYATRLSLKWDLSEMLAIIAETTIVVDNNETDFVDSEGGLTTRQRLSNVDLPELLLPGTTAPHNLRLGAGVFAQARF